MAKKSAVPQAQVRKPLLIVAGVALGAALIGFVLVNFVLGGGSSGGEPLPVGPGTGTTGGAATSPAPSVPASDVQTDGGRDPFDQSSGGAVSVPVPAEEAAPATTSPTTFDQQAAPAVAVGTGDDPVKVSVIRVYKDAADIKIGKRVYEGAHASQQLSARFQVDSIANGCVAMKDRSESFTACTGKAVQR